MTRAKPEHVPTESEARKAHRAEVDRAAADWLRDIDVALQDEVDFEATLPPAA